ncbi:hypothetical protein MGA3_06760 [Bacillus methanolicus MGA3]|uniref:Uncharacterized protein n=1 Tax=Bacillus methanolicus (strain MGA3 / ATCC 53907) TaxID=796606 RepID=I3E8T5_BACMM|nr:hypothetical protein BMMGA3_08855 [Bacillus methanolicus MGA3]EIJ82906.1 hypothetical protein MGA3_06760 [Bacillus methanolicus MGA3]UQD52166.1 hypothetical protein C0971_09160 [Bacillus methanolicus]
MRVLCATESGVYKLEDFAASKPQNLPPESCAKTRALTERYHEERDAYASNKGGTTEMELQPFSSFSKG